MINKKSVLAFAITSVICSNSAFATQFAVIPTTNMNTSKVEKTLEAEPKLFIVSNRHINRIVTPFDSPSIKMDNVAGVKTQSEGNVLYLSTTNDNLIAAFITENGDESNAIKVILKPMSVAPQEVLLSGTENGGHALAKRFEEASPRTEMITQVMAGVATGNLPSGYSVRAFNSDYLPACHQAGVLFDFTNGQFVSGGDYVVSVGVAQNTTTRDLNLQENFCYQDGVVAVSYFPKTTLDANEKVEVLVMYHRAEQGALQDNKPQRQSLIGGAM